MIMDKIGKTSPKYRRNVQGNKREYTSGREKQPVYLYDENYKHVLTFSSQSECSKYFGLKNGNLIDSRKGFRYMPESDQYITLANLKSKELRDKVIISNCPYCKTLENDQPVELFNRLGEKIGEIRSLRELRALADTPSGTLLSNYYNTKKGRTADIRRSLSILPKQK